MKKPSLKRRQIRKKPGSEPVQYLKPRKAKRSLSNTEDYLYFWGHTTKEIALQLPDQPVICWYSDHMLSLPVCAMRKFMQEAQYCKRCPLFQGDFSADVLRNLIQSWEEDRIDNLED